MGEEQIYTLMLVSHTNKPTFTCNFPLKWIKLIGFSFSFVAAVLLAFAYNFQEAKAAQAEFKCLSAEFQQQQQEILHIAKQAAELEKEIMVIHELDEQVRDMMQLSKKTDTALEEPENNVERIEASRVPTASRSGLAATILRTQLGLQAVRDFLPDGKDVLQNLTVEVASQQEKERATPSIWPTGGRITSGYGYRASPFGYGRQFHSGIDIGTSRGTPIYAAADGNVKLAGYQSGYGYVVYIEHGYGCTTVYAHMSKLGTKAGQQVEKGELIGYVGSSGRSTGPHLHYEVRIDGKTVNPRPFMD